MILSLHSTQKVTKCDFTRPEIYDIFRLKLRHSPRIMEVCLLFYFTKNKAKIFHSIVVSSEEKRNSIYVQNHLALLPCHIKRSLLHPNEIL